MNDAKAYVLTGAQRTWMYEVAKDCYDEADRGTFLAALSHPAHTARDFFIALERRTHGEAVMVWDTAVEIAKEWGLFEEEQNA